MSDYTKITDFAAKDALPTGDPLKRGKGTEVDNEFNAIETAIATKADKASPVLTGTPTAPTPDLLTAGDSEVANVEYVRSAIYAAVPIGMIMMWGGQVGVYPDGWELCNGSVYTRSDGAGTITSPDLRDRFVAAAGSTKIEGNFAGSDTHTHTTASGGSHNHTGVTGATTLTESQIPPHTHSGVPQAIADTDRGIGNSSLFSIDVSSTTGSTGGGAAHDHVIANDGDHSHSVNAGSTLPAYYALAFLIRI